MDWIVGSVVEPPLINLETVLADIPASFASFLYEVTPARNIATHNEFLLILYILLVPSFNLWYDVCIELSIV